MRSGEYEWAASIPKFPYQKCAGKIKLLMHDCSTSRFDIVHGLRGGPRHSHYTDCRGGTSSSGVDSARQHTGYFSAVRGCFKLRNFTKSRISCTDMVLPSHVGMLQLPTDLFS